LWLQIQPASERDYQEPSRLAESYQGARSDVAAAGGYGEQYFRQPSARYVGWQGALVSSQNTLSELLSFEFNSYLLVWF